MAGDPEVRPCLRHARCLEPGAGPRALRRRQLPLRHRRHLAGRAPPRCTARDGDRALPHGARAEGPARSRSRRSSRRSPRSRASCSGSGASSCSARCCGRRSSPGCTARSASSRSSVEPSSAGASIFTAIIVLTIMILPIVSSISRELFLGVPHDLKEGALALGTTRWEMVRGVIFPYSSGGIAAALILGLGRALGEAIAVTQVIGGGVVDSMEPVRRRRHAGQQDRGVVPGRDVEARDRVADLPRRDPARVLARRERRGAVDRPPFGEEARHHPRRPRVSAQGSHRAATSATTACRVGARSTA